MSMRMRPIYALVAAVAMMLPRDAAAQSTELDRPTSLTALDLKVPVESELVHYYSFDAGPGEFSIMAVAQIRGLGMHVNWTVFDAASMTKLASETTSATTSGVEEQKMLRYSPTTPKKTKILLKVEVFDLTMSRGAYYRFRLGGAVDVGGDATWIPGVPRDGVLRILMKDGSTKDINLRDVSTMSVKQ